MKDQNKLHPSFPRHCDRPVCLPPHLAMARGGFLRVKSRDPDFIVKAVYEMGVLTVLGVP